MADSQFNGTWVLSQAEYQELKNAADALSALIKSGIIGTEDIDAALSDQGGGA